MFSSASTSSRPSSAGSDNLMLAIEGLPNEWTWRDVKDLARNKAEHVQRANEGTSTLPNGTKAKVWVVSLNRKNEALDLFSWLATRPIENRRLTVHLVEKGRIINKNCTEGRCNLCGQRANSAPQSSSISSSGYPVTSTIGTPTTALPSSYTTSTAASPMYRTTAAAYPTRYPAAAPPTLSSPEVQTALNTMRAQRAAGMPLDSEQEDLLRRIQQMVIRDRAAPATSGSDTIKDSLQPRTITQPMYAATTVSGAPINTSRGYALTELRGVFVSGLGYKTRQQDLVKLFTRAGRIVHCEVQANSQGRSKGTATILFETVEAAKAAISVFNGYKYEDRVLRVRSDREGVVTSIPSARTPASQAGDTTSQEPIIADGSNSRQGRRDSKVSTTK